MQKLWSDQILASRVLSIEIWYWCLLLLIVYLMMVAKVQPKWLLIFDFVLLGNHYTYLCSCTLYCPPYGSSRVIHDATIFVTLSVSLYWKIWNGLYRLLWKSPTCLHHLPTSYEKIGLMISSPITKRFSQYQCCLMRAPACIPIFPQVQQYNLQTKNPLSIEKYLPIRKREARTYKAWVQRFIIPSSKWIFGTIYVGIPPPSGLR